VIPAGQVGLHAPSSAAVAGQLLRAAGHPATSRKRRGGGGGPLLWTDPPCKEPLSHSSQVAVIDFVQTCQARLFKHLLIAAPAGNKDLERKEDLALTMKLSSFSEQILSQ
jgi:hypothetical protein